MKLIKGETLAALLAARPNPRGRFVAAFAQVCQAVAYAHSRGVIHRDLKPANVMVGAFGEVQVMDWGLAKVLTGEAGGSRSGAGERTQVGTGRDAEPATQAGSVLGTPAYMAPEQAAGAVDQVDERSDVFGLGATLCAVLTGRPPYVRPTSEAVRSLAIRCETAEAFARLDASGADPELVALCKRCLARDREARPRNAGAVAGALAAHLAAAEEHARQAELNRVRSEEGRKRRRVQRALRGAILGLVTLAAFGAALGVLWRVARQAQGEAETARDLLDDEKRRTEGARDEALLQKGIADRALAGEAKARKLLEVVLYGRTLQVAYDHWRDDHIAAALALLDGIKPELRGWEWRYVHRLCHGSLVTFKGHSSTVKSAQFFDDGSRVLTASYDGTARVWDARTGAELLTLKGYFGSPSSVSFSPDGSRLLTAGDDTVRIWDARPVDREFVPR